MGVTIDPSAVDPTDVEMLQDLIVAAVTDAQRAARELARVEDGGRHRRSPPARDVACSARRSDRAGRALIESFARPARHRTQDRPAADVSPAARPRYRSPRPCRRPDRGAGAGRFLRALLQHQRSARLLDLLRPGRDAARLCVVEEPLDVLALERTGEFKGLYHVLHGAISPIDGVGPSVSRSGNCSSARTRRTGPARDSRRSSSPRTPLSKERPRQCTWPSVWSRWSAA